MRFCFSAAKILFSQFVFFISPVFWRTKPKTKKRARKKAITASQQKQNAKLIIYQIYKTINEHFPTLFDQLANLLTDPRKRRAYALSEIVLATVMMFLLREGSRNAFNSDRRQETFIKNYERLFGLRLPHMDTVEDVLRLLQPDELEKLKACLVSGLIEKKVFHKFKFLGKRFIIAIDGTGLYSYAHKHCDQCLHKTSSTGTTTYFHHVLEAKLVTANGMAISLCTEWIANDPESQFDKQDCEHKAFKRMAIKLKKLFPRLPICITADGLYPNQHFFAICEQHGWDFMVTLKDGNLPSVQEEVALLRPLISSSTTRIITRKHVCITQTYQWINGVEYKNTPLHWIECIEETLTTSNTATKQVGEVETSRFVHVTNLEITSKTACEISDGGRLRWKIENEGFNTQKNNGYNIEHKYSQVSFQALKNYYQCLQIAHLINQLVEKSVAMAALIAEFSIIYLWKKMLTGFLIWIELDENELASIKEQRWQIRLIK